MGYILWRLKWQWSCCFTCMLLFEKKLKRCDIWTRYCYIGRGQRLDSLSAISRLNDMITSNWILVPRNEWIDVNPSAVTTCYMASSCTSDRMRQLPHRSTDFNETWHSRVTLKFIDSLSTGHMTVEITDILRRSFVSAPLNSCTNNRAY
jgi:hypothetical protein